MSVGDTLRQRHWFKLALSAARKLKRAEQERWRGFYGRHHVARGNRTRARSRSDCRTLWNGRFFLSKKCAMRMLRTLKPVRLRIQPQGFHAGREFGVIARPGFAKRHDPSTSALLHYRNSISALCLALNLSALSYRDPGNRSAYTSTLAGPSPTSCHPSTLLKTHSHRARSHPGPASFKSLYQKRPPQNSDEATNFSSAVASDTTLGSLGSQRDSFARLQTCGPAQCPG